MISSRPPRGVVRHRRDPRAVVSLKARYRSPTIFEFVENECYDLSRGGMFMATHAPAAVGTLIKFECEVDAGRQTFSGVGRVLWTREDDTQTNKPAGMAVKFVRLDEGAAEIVDHMVQQHGALGEGYLARQEVRESQQPSAPPDGGSEPGQRGASEHAEPGPSQSVNGHEQAEASQSSFGVSEATSAPTEPTRSEAEPQEEAQQAHITDAETAASSRTEEAASTEASEPEAEPDTAGPASAEADADSDKPREAAAAASDEPAERPSDAPPRRVDEAADATPTTPARSEPPSTRRYTPVLLALVFALLMGVWALLSDDAPQDPARRTPVAENLEPAPSEPSPTQAAESDEPQPTQGRNTEPAPTTIDEPVDDEVTAIKAPPGEVPDSVAKPEVRLVSEPNGATVRIDGEPVGETPLSLELPAGEDVNVTLAKEGYASLDETVRIDAEGAELRFELQPEGEKRRYVLHVITTPPKARVTAKDVSDVAPSHFRTVDFSEPVKVLASKKGYRDTAAIVRPDDFEANEGVLEHRIYLRLKKE